MFEFIKKFRIAVFAAVLSGAGLVDYAAENYTIEIKRIPKPTEVTEPATPYNPVRNIRDEPDTLIKSREKIEINNWAYYLKDPILAAIRASYFDFVVMDTESRYKPGKFNRDDINSLKQFYAGKRKIFAYFSAGSAEAYRDYYKEEWKDSPPEWQGDANKFFKGVYRVNDLMSPEWQEVTRNYIIAIMDAGFDGVVLDFLQYRPADEVKPYLIFIQSVIKPRNEDFRIYLQDNLNLDLMDYIDGVVKQNLYYLWGIERNDDFEKDMERVKWLLDSGKNVVVVSYVKERERWEKIKKELQQLNIPGYWAPVQLDVLRLNQ